MRIARLLLSTASFLLLAAPAIAAETAEIFVDKEEIFTRVGKKAGFDRGDELTIVGPAEGDGARRTVGTGTVLEAWASMARISLDKAAQANLPDVYVLLGETATPMPAAAETPEPAVAPKAAPAKDGAGPAKMKEGAPDRRRAAASADASAGDREPAGRTGSAFFDPLGFLIFGPTAGLEFGGEHLAATVYGRLFSAGILANGMFRPAGTNFAAYGFGIRGRNYLKPGLSGMHVGFLVEYLRSRIEGRSPPMATLANFVIPGFEFGHRFALGRMYLDGSLMFGYAMQFGSRLEDLSGEGREFSVEDESSVYGCISLDVGIYF